MAYNNYNNRNVTELEMTYPNGAKETFESIMYPGSTSFSFQCTLNELPEDIKMTYYYNVTSYCSEKCLLIDDPNEHYPFSLDGCCNQSEIEEEIEESKKIQFEYDKNGREYRVIEAKSSEPVRKCWCKFIYDIVNTGEGTIKFGPKDNSFNAYPCYILIKGNKIIGSSSSETEIIGQITFDTQQASKVRKDKKCDFIYEDTVNSEYIKIRQWDKYSVSSVNIEITISRFPYQFILVMHDLSLRTTSLTNCHTDGNLSAKDDCNLKDCWCTAYNSLRTVGKFNITVPMRIIKHTNPYHEKNEYSTTIEGKINAFDKDKMDLTFKFASKWIHNNNNYYNDY
jgi:hypothetical protein